MAEKKRINSKHKGSEYERKIAKVLSKWWGESFQRTPASGGLHWHADNRVAGDIVTPPESKYPFVTELKKREGWGFEQIMKATGEVEDWWQQVTNDAERTGLRRLLIFSKNFAPDYVMMTVEDFMYILPMPTTSIPFNFFLVHKVGHEQRIVFILDDFIKHISKEDVLKAYGL